MKILLVTSAAVLLCSASMAMPGRQGPGPGLGRTPSAIQIAEADLSISPDGSNLPAGSGTVARGLAVYRDNCEACHGSLGKGGLMDQLTGGVGSLNSSNPVKTVASYWPSAVGLFDYIRRAMPYPAPQSLSADDIYAVIAYLLSIDRIVPKSAVLNAQSLPKVKMPNRDGFVRWWPAPGRASPDRSRR